MYVWMDGWMDEKKDNWMHAIIIKITLVTYVYTMEEVPKHGCH